MHAGNMRRTCSQATNGWCAIAVNDNLLPAERLARFDFKQFISCGADITCSWGSK